MTASTYRPWVPNQGRWTMANDGTVATWHTKPGGDDGMGDAHTPVWRRMIEVSKLGASYIAAMGCHRDMPLWPRWRALIASMSTVKVQNHSLEDVAGAFSAAGFTIAARSLQLEDFLPVDVDNQYYPRIVDLIRFY